MDKYDGQVTLILDDGTEIEGIAALRLTDSAVGVWGGVIRSRNGGALYQIHEDCGGRLRFSDGREAAFLSAAFQVEVGRMSIRGRGNAPF
ncbi:hypothetical protein ACGFIR_30920 [Micromonospora sp. NPDC049051]|uniref:hypothetical protein n=1 Tax=unclassified Micromonospora TaxID=2617518 RepID=UPI0037192ADE